MKTRIYFLDNLRTFMIFLVVVLHSAITYAPVLENMWIVSDPSKSGGLALVVIYLDIFIMFIMFFISGYFIPQSFNKTSFWLFTKSKFRRIMIPWMVAVFTLIPMQKIIFLYSRGLPQEEWFTYFHLFAREGGNPGFFADAPAQSWLWFLPILFLFQVLYAGLARAGILKIRINLKSAVLLTFSVGLAYSMLIAILNLNGWFDSPVLHFQKERILIYFLFFLLGSLCYKLKVFESIKNAKGYFILSNVVLTISLSVFTIVAMNFFYNIMDPSRNQFLVSELIDGLLYYTSVLLSAFAFMYIFIHIFRNKLNKSGMILGEMSKNSYGVYIIHMIVIGVLSLIFLNFSYSAYIKFPIVAIMSFILANLIVSFYRRTLKKSLSNYVFRYAVLPAAILLSIVIYTQEEEPTPATDQPSNARPAPTISMHMAAIQGDTTTIQQYLSAGSDVNMTEASAGSTPLITASLFGKKEVVQILVDAGADVNFQNNEGSTALHTAAFFCHPDIVKILLAADADLSIRNKAGSTALESVQAPWDMVKGIYEYFGNTLGPLGLEIDYKYLEDMRPEITRMLQNPSINQ